MEIEEYQPESNNEFDKRWMLLLEVFLPSFPDVHQVHTDGRNVSWQVNDTSRISMNSVWQVYEKG